MQHFIENLSRLLLPVILFCLCISCKNFPKDPKRTLEKTEGKDLRVGVTENPPFILFKEKDPTGTEIQFLTAFAKDLNANITWVKASETTLLTLLKKGAIDIAAGGFSSESVWTKHAYLTIPHDTIVLKWGVPRRLNLPTQLQGLTIYAINDISARAAVKTQNANVIYRDTLVGTEELVIGTEKELMKLNYKMSDEVLGKEKISFAIQKGENAFLKRLENFINEYSHRRNGKVE